MDADPSNVVGYEAAVSRLNRNDVITPDFGVGERAKRAQAALITSHPGNLPAALLGFRMDRGPSRSH